MKWVTYMDKLFAKIDALNDSYIQIWKDICEIESPTACKEGVDAVSAYLLRIAQQRGWAVRLCPQGVAGNAFSVTINPDVDAPAVVFSGHMDTVFPVGTFGETPVRTDSGNIYGPGVMDCKGGVVASFMAMDALWQCGFRSRPVKFIAQSDEETGSKTSGKATVAFMLEEAKGAAAFLNTEGIQGNTAVLARKGILRYRFTVCGKAAHSSKCYVGANAVTEAAYKILQLEQMKDPEGLTCNCGVIQGGTVANSVAAECSFTADIRFANYEQYQEAEKLVRQVAESNTVVGCTCQLEKVSDRPAMPWISRNEALLDKMNSIYEAAGLPVLTPRACLSGSDAAYTTNAGIPTVDNLGVDGANIHSVQEFARLDSLAASAKRLAAVAYGL